VNHPGGELVPSATHSRSSTAPCAPSAPRAPVASLATTDLWAELKRRRSGEDNRITIERHWERHRNLDRAFGAVDTTPMRQAAHTPTSLRSGGGCMVLAPYLRIVV
jgi:hypothetical protein